MSKYAMRQGKKLLILALLFGFLLPASSAPARRKRPSKGSPPPATPTPGSRREAFRLSPLDPFLGQWRGEGTGIRGGFETSLNCSYSDHLEGSFIECRWTDTYKAGREGEPPVQDSGIAYVGFDKISGEVFASVFHSNGIALQYAGSPVAGDTEAVLELAHGRNIPEAFRARVTTTLDSPDRFHTVCEWAPTGRELTAYKQVTYTRVLSQAPEPPEAGSTAPPVQ